MSKLPIALQLYSVRQEIMNDPEGTLSAVADMGYEGVELAGFGPYDAAGMQTALLKRGLTPVSAHIPLGEMITDPQGVLGAYAAMGCGYVAIPHLGEADRPGGANFAHTLAAIQTVGAAAAALGMQLLYHNHDFEMQLLEGETLLDRLYRITDPSLLAAQPDVCWLQVGGEDPAAFVTRYAGRVPLVHLKNYAGGKTAHMYDLIGLAPGQDAPEQKPFEMRPLGDGLVNIAAVVAAAEQAGTRWLVVEQDTPTPGKTALQCAKESIDYLHTLA